MKRIPLLPLTLLFCAAAALLRLWQVNAGFEGDTGLPISGHPAGLLLGVLTAAAALLLIWLTRPLQREQVQFADLSHRPPARWPLTLSAVLFTGAGCAVLWQLLLDLGELSHQAFLEGTSLLNLLPHNLMNFYMPLLSGGSLLLAGLFLLRWTWQMLRAVPSPATSGPVLGGFTAALPAFSCCMLLISIYQSHANDPAVQGYFWTELALFLAMLAWYGLTGLWYTSGKRWPLTALCLLAAVMQCAALFSPQNLFAPELLLVTLGNLVWFLTRGAQLLAMERKPAEQS